MSNKYCVTMLWSKKTLKKNIFLCLGLMVYSLVGAQSGSIVDEREWIQSVYLPALKGSVLYIGVGSYTASYYTYVQNPELFETVDLLEERAQYGSPFKHYIGDFMSVPTDVFYDHVSFFGILGFNAPYFSPFKTKEQIVSALERVDSLLKSNGTLQVSGQIGGTPYLIEGQGSDFWLEMFGTGILKKYKTIACLLSSQNVIWWGQKIES